MSTIVRDPIYKQVGAALRSLIHSEAFAPGDQFLSEREVADRFGISRITSNKALAALVGEGLLEHRRGIGNFVRPPKMGYDLRSLVSFTEMAHEAGAEPSTRVLRYEVRRASKIDAAIRERLEAQPDTEIGVMERLRLADDLPVILERRWIRLDACPGFTRHDCEGSLYAVLTERFGLRLTGSNGALRAVNLDRTEAKLMQTSVGAAGFLISGVGYASRPLWYEETLYRGDSYEISLAIGGS